MPEEYLQAAFEIKASCDEISRRILRWHWESKPGPHSFDALLDRIRQRQEESPAYYGHMPDVARKTSWQQLDTTLCMRVLLDPESETVYRFPTQACIPDKGDPYPQDGIDHKNCAFTSRVKKGRWASLPDAQLCLAVKTYEEDWYLIPTERRWQE